MMYNLNAKNRSSVKKRDILYFKILLLLRMRVKQVDIVAKLNTAFSTIARLKKEKIVLLVCSDVESNLYKNRLQIVEEESGFYYRINMSEEEYLKHVCFVDFISPSLSLVPKALNATNFTVKQIPIDSDIAEFLSEIFRGSYGSTPNIRIDNENPVVRLKFRGATDFASLYELFLFEFEKDGAKVAIYYLVESTFKEFIEDFYKTNRIGLLKDKYEKAHEEWEQKRQLESKDEKIESIKKEKSDLEELYKMVEESDKEKAAKIRMIEDEKRKREQLEKEIESVKMKENTYIQDSIKDLIKSNANMVRVITNLQEINRKQKEKLANFIKFLISKDITNMKELIKEFTDYTKEKEKEQSDIKSKEIKEYKPKPEPEQKQEKVKMYWDERLNQMRETK